MDPTVNPSMSLVADHLSPDTGVAGGYDDELRFLLPDLDFGEPDRVKLINEIEVIYESLKEVPISIEVFRRAVLTDPGSTSESVDLTTQASMSDEPGVFWAEDDPVWGTTRFATYKIYSAKGQFAFAQGKSFNVGVKVTCDLTPVRILEILFKFHQERTPYKEAGTDFTL